MSFYLQDVILAELVSCKKEWIVGYHEHDSLLEKRPEEDLSEEERKAAWEEYEREKKGFIYGYVCWKKKTGIAWSPLNHVVDTSEMNVYCRFGGYEPMIMGGISVTQAPIQIPRNPPFTTYLRPPEPKSHLQGKFYFFSCQLFRSYIICTYIVQFVQFQATLLSF